jgi:hypothetical protein
MGSELCEQRLLLDERYRLLKELVDAVDESPVVGVEVHRVIVDALVQDFFHLVHQLDDLLEKAVNVVLYLG